MHLLEEIGMLNQTVAGGLTAALAASVLAVPGGAWAADPPQPTMQERKSTSSPKAKAPAKATPKPKAVQGKKKIPRVEDAPDFKA
jgi:hypothetical protein